MTSMKVPTKVTLHTKKEKCAAIRQISIQDEILQFTYYWVLLFISQADLAVTIYVDLCMHFSFIGEHLD